MIFTLFPFALVASLCAADDQWHGVPADFVMPGDVITPISRAFLSAVEYPVDRVGDMVDVLILADASGSAQSIFEQEAAAAEEGRQRRLQEEDTTYSLAIFVDKPINTLGELGDFCFRPIVTSANSKDDLKTFMQSYIPNGGWDWPENQYGAIMAAIGSPVTFPWMTGYASPLIIMITDAAPHFEGDSYQSKYSSLLPWGDSYDETAADEYCRHRYYPSSLTLRDNLLSSGVRLAQIIAQPTAYDGRALAAAQWLNGYLGQPEEYVIAHESGADYWHEVDALVDLFRSEMAETTISPESENTDTSALATDSEADTSLIDETIVA